MFTNRFQQNRWLSLCLIVVGGFLLFYALVGLLQQATYAQEGIRYVAPAPLGNDSDNECTDSASPCATVQHAVDTAVSGDEIRIAAGEYTDLYVRQGITQVVYITKTLTLRGGFSLDNWIIPVPEYNLSILNAQNKGRVLYITGSISSTIEGLYITGGSAVDGGGAVGGGLYIVDGSEIRLFRNRIYNNKATQGGGIFLKNNQKEIVSTNIITGNHADESAGLHIEGSLNTLLVDNIFRFNQARATTTNHGGGVFCKQSRDLTVIHNNISNNLGNDTGGGIQVSACENVLLSENLIGENTANTGAGIHVDNSTITLTNNVIIDNRAWIAGSGLYVENSSLQLWHNTIAHNYAGEGSGIHINGTLDTAFLTNNIIANHAVGIVTTATSRAIINGILWHDNGIKVSGVGNLTITNEHEGDAAFAEDGYHLTAVSAAIDKCTTPPITTDIDGDLRPMGNGCDFGADELRIDLDVSKQAHANISLFGKPLTYTLRVTNTGDLTLTATITDLLPAGLVATAPISWQTTLAPAQVWEQELVANMTTCLRGVLQNRVEVVSVEGAQGEAVSETAVLCRYLPLIKKQ